MKVFFQKLTETALEPYRGSERAAGYDLYADIQEAIEIPPHKTVKIPTGIAIALPEHNFGAIYPRSGLATKYGIRLANCVGVIDEDYRGEIFISLHNDSDSIQQIFPQDRIAQLIVQPYQTIEFSEVPKLDETARGDGGFGSSGGVQGEV